MDEDHELAYECQLLLLDVNRELGRHKDMLRNARTLLACQRKHLPKYHPSRALVSFRAAEACEQLGDAKQGCAHFREAAEVLAIAYGPKHEEVQEIRRRLGQIVN